VFQNDKKMADDDVKFKLAVSLHSGIDETARIMPLALNFLWPIYANHWNIGTKKTKSKISMNTWFGKTSTKPGIDRCISEILQICSLQSKSDRV
jgi:23S rRNA (adenine2503-C2)-methyltransferase